MAKFYRVKEVSRHTSATVRTLQYYDEIGLLKPSERTESGHRLYSDRDLLKLQQINTLKFMGFKLTKILDLMRKSDFDLSDSLIFQKDVLEEQITRLQKAKKLIQQALDMLQFRNEISWQTTAKIIEILNITTMETKTWETWTKEYFTQHEQKQFEEIQKKFSQTQINNYNEEWEKLFNEAKTILDLEPSSDKVQQCVIKWLNWVNKVYSEYPNLALKIWDAYKLGAVPIQHMPYYDQQVIDFMDKAFIIHNTKINK